MSNTAFLLSWTPRSLDRQTTSWAVVLVCSAELQHGGHVSTNAHISISLQSLKKRTPLMYNFQARLQGDLELRSS